MTDSALSPQQPRPTRSSSRKTVSALVAVAAALIVGWLVWNLVGGSLFFYNADEAVERRSELGDERFTLQGAPIGCSIIEGFQDEQSVVAFSVAFEEVAVDIVHSGDPAELFQADVPVVLDGHWVQAAPEVEGFSGVANDGWHFASDRMRVKHDNDYTDENSDRIADGESQGITEEVCS